MRASSSSSFWADPGLKPDSLRWGWSENSKLGRARGSPAPDFTRPTTSTTHRGRWDLAWAAEDRYRQQWKGNSYACYGSVIAGRRFFSSSAAVVVKLS